MKGVEQLKISLIRTIYACLTIINLLISTPLRVITLLLIYQLATPSSLDYEWKVHDDLCGSDHVPIFLNNIASGVEELSEKWK